MHRVIIAGGFDPVTLDITTIRTVVVALAQVFRDEDDVNALDNYPDEIVILEEQRYAATGTASDRHPMDCSRFIAGQHWFASSRLYSSSQPGARVLVRWCIDCRCRGIDADSESSGQGNAHPAIRHA
jgi:hypothetical protein